MGSEFSPKGLSYVNQDFSLKGLSYVTQGFSPDLLRNPNSAIQNCN